MLENGMECCVQCILDAYYLQELINIAATINPQGGTHTVFSPYRPDLPVATPCANVREKSIFPFWLAF